MASCSLGQQTADMPFPDLSVRTQSMESTGEAIIKEYCAQYETSTSSSYVLPPVMDSVFTEKRDFVTNNVPRPTRKLTTYEAAKHKGIVTEQSGEISEYRVFSLFHQHIRTKQSYQSIVLRKFDLDNNNNRSVKEMELLKELPSIDLSSVNMKTEHDFIVIIKCVGVILLEVKSKASTSSMNSAEIQLSNGKSLIYAIMGGIRGKSKSLVPVEKVIIVPNDETSPSPTHKTNLNSHQLHQDQISNFSSVINSIVTELQEYKEAYNKNSSTSMFTSSDFWRFTRIIIGLWCLTPMQSGFSFNLTLASTAAMVKEVDRKVDEQEISSFHIKSQSKKPQGKYNKPVTDVEFCQSNEVYRTSKEVKAIYLTPQQKHILDNEPQALISGGAGAGKTLITLFKCINIIQNDLTAKVLIVVPYPHDVRCHRILSLNNIRTQRVKTFPPDDITTSSIFIIDLRNFFKEDISCLLAYNLESFHVFMDDLQALKGNFQDIATFITHHFKTSVTHKKHFWCCFDAVQGSNFNFDDLARSPRLLLDNSITPNIPTFELKKILRNTCEIIPVVTKMREERINESLKHKKLPPNMHYGEVTLGHQITGAPLLYHKLAQHNSKEHHDPFVLQMVEEELSILLKEQPFFKPSDVAILHEGIKDSLKESIGILIDEKLGFGIQTIEEFITKDDNGSVILDGVNNAMSYEVPCVLYVLTRRRAGVSIGLFNYRYVITSRARARLTIIDAHVADPPFITLNCTSITWTESKGTFVKH